MDFIRDCVSWPEWWLFALAAPCVVALLIIAITEIKSDRYWRAWIPLWMYGLPVPTPCEIGGETSGSYEGNSTLSGSRTKTVDTRSRRKRHSKARNMRTSEKKKRKAKRKRRTRRAIRRYRAQLRCRQERPRVVGARRNDGFGLGNLFKMEIWKKG